MKSKKQIPIEAYEDFLDTIADAALLANPRGEIVFFNEPAQRLFGETDGDLWASRIEQLVPDQAKEHHQKLFEGYWEAPYSRSMAQGADLRAVTVTGNTIPVSIKLNPLTLAGAPYVLAVCRDMTHERNESQQLKKALAQERDLARTDPITGAANRRHLSNELHYEIERSNRNARVFTLAYFDLDNFKAVNDLYGHHEGDAVLRHICDSAQKRLRKTDLMARVGGDEFAILLPETDTQQMRSPINDIMSAMRAAMAEGGWPITISCGVVTFRTPPPGPEQALQAADELMYEVKQNGKNASREAVFDRSSEQMRN